MSDTAFIGVNGVARAIDNSYIGVGNIAREIEKGYIGVDGVAREFYQNALVLYSYGKTDYTLTTRGYSGNTTTRGTIANDCCYINSGSRMANTDGNSDIDSHLGSPSFVINNISELNATDILNYSKLEVTYSIGESSSSLVDDITISLGGWAGWDWSYNTNLEYKSDAYYWQCRSVHEKGTVGTFTKQLDITSTKSATNGLYWFLRNTAYCGTTKYKELAKNFYFGAYTYVNNDRDWFCKVPVYFYEIKLLS